MAHLIDKDAVVAEIKRKRDICKKVVWDLRTRENQDYYQGKAEAYSEMAELINTLEVKEVDFIEELDKEWNKCEPIDEGMGLEIASIEHEQFDNIAKHFFELGLKVKDK